MAVLAMIDERPELAKRPIANQPYVLAEFVYAVRHEMATTLEDLLTRRTRAHLHDARGTLLAAPVIAHVVADDLGWDEAVCASQVALYRRVVEREFDAAGLAL